MRMWLQVSPKLQGMNPGELEQSSLCPGPLPMDGPEQSSAEPSPPLVSPPSNLQPPFLFSSHLPLHTHTLITTCPDSPTTCPFPDQLAGSSAPTQKWLSKWLDLSQDFWPVCKMRVTFLTVWGLKQGDECQVHLVDIHSRWPQLLHLPRGAAQSPPSALPLPRCQPLSLSIHSFEASRLEKSDWVHCRPGVDSNWRPVSVLLWGRVWAETK